MGNPDHSGSERGCRQEDLQSNKANQDLIDYNDIESPCDLSTTKNWIVALENEQISMTL